MDTKGWVAAKEYVLQELDTMGYSRNLIRRTIKVYEKNYGTELDFAVVQEIIIRLQNKDKSRFKQKIDNSESEPSPITMDIQQRHYDIVARYSYTSIPSDVLNTITLFYATPIAMRILCKQLNKPIILIAYCPADDTVDTLTNKISKSWDLSPSDTITSIKYAVSSKKVITLTKYNIDHIKWDVDKAFIVNVTDPNWKEVYDKVSGRTYYANMKTRETRWYAPPGWEKKKESVSKPKWQNQHHGNYGNYVSGNWGYSSNVDLKYWEAVNDSLSGKTYYYNIRTNETRWNPPPEWNKTRDKK